MDKRYNIPCEVIQDLMPSYVDGIASEETGRIIEDHVAGCAECGSILEAMRAGSDAQTKPEDRDRKEIDFLRKNRSRNKKIFAACIAAALILVCGIFAVKNYFIGQDWTYAVATDVRVSGTDISIEATSSDSAHFIRNIELTEKDGVVTAVPKAVAPSPLTHQTSTGSVTDGDGNILMEAHICDTYKEASFSNEIREVRIGDRVIWAEGKDVSALASSVMQTVHDYVGDPSANERTLEALCVRERFGDYTNQLQTEKEPYGWTVTFEEDLGRFNAAVIENEMDNCARVLLGSVGNLGEVTFEYKYNGKVMNRTVSAEEAAEFFGRNIKDCLTSARAMSDLIDMTGLR